MVDSRLMTSGPAGTGSPSYPAAGGLHALRFAASADFSINYRHVVLILGPFGVLSYSERRLGLI
jgi:hypothetical protein